MSAKHNRNAEVVNAQHNKYNNIIITLVENFGAKREHHRFVDSSMCVIVFSINGIALFHRDYLEIDLWPPRWKSIKAASVGDSRDIRVPAMRAVDDVVRLDLLVLAG